MKKLFFAACLFIASQSNSQLLVNLNLPPQGVVEKSQLWHMTLINGSTTNLALRIDLVMSEAVAGTPVLSASTKLLTVPPGATQISNADLQPIQYNVLSLGYNIDASPYGLLPIGVFEACYSFVPENTDKLEKLAEECREVAVEPLSPPQLIMPYDQSVVDTKNPQLSWLPPVPAHLFTNLKYDFELVEMLPSQSALDAIQQNIPLFQQSFISTTTLMYPQGAPALELDKLYAWRVIAKTGETRIGQSETWVFTIKEFEKADSLVMHQLPYGELRREDLPSYAVFTNGLKFDYLNEYGDTTWNLAVYDLLSPDRRKIHLNMDSTPLKPGQNLVSYDLRRAAGFVDKHLYLLEVINSRKESWRLRFEYRKSDD